MIEVIAGIIINKKNQVLITRRKLGKHLEGFWEFPGGKLETNESPEECLVREIKEELDINISVGKHITNSVFQYETINESKSNSVAIHLFEVYEKGNYVYQGEVELVNEVYQETQPDDNEDLRRVWMFP